MRLFVLPPAFLLLALLPAESAIAQCPTDLVEEGVRAYRELHLDTAAELLREALQEDAEAEPCPDRARTMAFLGATELFRGNRAAALDTFRSLVAYDPRFRPDELVFPPEVTDLFDEARRTTPAVTATVPAEMRIRAGRDVTPIGLFASAPHRVRVLVAAEGGEPLREVFEGLVADSVALGWDGMDREGRAVPDGSYELRVSSLTNDGESFGRLIVPLQVMTVADATGAGAGGRAGEGAEPDREASARRSGWAAVGSLAAGLLAATAIVLVPRAAGTSSIHGEGAVRGTGRILLGGAAVAVGAAGFAHRIRAPGGAEATEALPPVLRIRSGVPERRSSPAGSGDDP